MGTKCPPTVVSVGAHDEIAVPQAGGGVSKAPPLRAEKTRGGAGGVETALTASLQGGGKEQERNCVPLWKYGRVRSNTTCGLRQLAPSARPPALFLTDSLRVGVGGHRI